MHAAVQIGVVVMNHFWKGIYSDFKLYIAFLHGVLQCVVFMCILVFIYINKRICRWPNLYSWIFDGKGKYQYAETITLNLGGWDVIIQIQRMPRYPMDQTGSKDRKRTCAHAGVSLWLIIMKVTRRVALNLSL